MKHWDAMRYRIYERWDEWCRNRLLARENRRRRLSSEAAAWHNSRWQREDAGTRRRKWVARVMGTTLR